MLERPDFMAQGVLLIHGFTATPDCLESLAVPLRERGYQVSAPLLPGHGTTVEELAGTSWEDWYQEVARAFDELYRKTGSVSVVGQSLGGLLGLMAASEFPVERLALLSTPLFFTSFLARVLLPVVGKTPLKHLYPYQSKWIGSAINDPEGRSRFKSYSKMPIPAVMEIVKLQKEVVRRLGRITVPALIIHSPHDRTVPYVNMAALKKKLGSKVVKTLTLERSDHVLTMDYEKELVAGEIVKFLGGNP